MANYGLDKMGALGKLAKSVVLTAGTAVVGGVLKIAISGIKTSRCNSRINDIDSEISDLRSGLLGNYRNADKISKLKNERNDLSNKRNKFF